MNSSSMPVFLTHSLSFDYKAIAANWLDEVKLKPVCQPTN